MRLKTLLPLPKRFELIYFLAPNNGTTFKN